MLSHDEALRLNQELAGTKVLSVYLNAEETDPAERRAWRVRLNGMLKGLEEALAAAPEAEREAVREAAALLQQALEPVEGLLPGRGWVGFATPDRLWYAGPSAVPMPDLARWENGAHVSPYVRALKQSRPVTVVVADSRRARVLRYLHGALHEEAAFSSEAAGAEGTSGASKRAATHSGVRGEPTGDVARRSREASTQRMLREVLGAVAQPVSEGHLLVAAGDPATTAALLRALPERARTRAIEAPGVHADATPAELKEAIEAAASALSARLQRALVHEVVDATRSAGRACLGREPTERALQAGAVDTLLFARAFARADPEAAERLVDRALEQGAAVEEVSDALARELGLDGGIGARLRYVA
ncbi:MAG TPA: hypothetical protein VFL93_12160 [Longimicrobiaceae bacterium]|nr:hypothetical protein [Longimicrobiaceae bacterium]